MITKVFIIGFDNTSNGGIASVVKSYLKCAKINNDISFITLKTNYYKDKNIIFEISILISSIIKYFIIICKDKVDIIHIHSSGNISFYRKSIFLLLSKLFKKKTIFHLHSSNFYSFFLTTNIFKQKIIKYILNLADLVLVLNDDWLYKLKKRFPTIKIKKLHNPIELTFSKPLIKESINTNFTVLFLGFLIESKGILDILKTADLTKETNITYYIFGKGELDYKVVEYSSQNPKVIYGGWIDGIEKEDFLKKSDILFLPSYNEGLPIVILEALSYSLPVVSTKISGIPEQIIDGVNGYLLDSADVEGFARKIIHFSKMNLDEINSFRIASYYTSLNFADEKIFTELSAIYKSLIL
jgi:glycosyltransferase involved in cell wall biosynthesis